MLLDIAHGLLDQYMVLFGTIVADDGSSMRAQMKWSNMDWMEHNKTTEPPKVHSKKTKVDC